jgi:hypothetical protein
MENKLDPEFKAKWIAALRSGEYKQGQNMLCNRYDNSYCCLGVAGAICGATPGSMHGMLYFDPQSTNVPEGYPAVLVASTNVRGTLMKMNDTDDKSFLEIAEYIEANL